jgi:hypothetical protein
MYKKGIGAALLRTLILALALGTPVFCQTFGEITGTVIDSSGGAVSGANVSVTNPQTNATRQTTTNATGTYSFPALQPGVYNIRVEFTGFQTELQSNVELQVQQVARIDFTLKAGAVTETVEVAASAPLVNTEDAAVGTVIENKRVVDLPLNGRNFLSLVALSPNVSTGYSSATIPNSGGASVRQGGDRATTDISVAGQRREYNNYTIDGVTNTDVNYNLYVFLPSIDMIQEFKVQTGIYPAEFGRGIGQINVSTKSGTNQYHGTLYEFFRNNKTDARPYAFTSNVPAIAPFKWNQFGFSLGGPIQIPKVFNGKDRLFFSSGYEGFRLRKEVQNLYSTIPAAMRTGNFSQLLPNTVMTDPQNRNAAGVKQPYPGNIIPQSEITSPAVTLLGFDPLPNVPGATLSNNYLGVYSSPTDKDQFTQRIDFVENASSSWFGRYSWSQDTQYTPGLYLSGSDLTATAHQATITNTRILSPSIVNEARFGFNAFDNANLGDLTYKDNVVAQLGPQFILGNFGPFDYGLPAVTLTGYTGIGPAAEGPYQFIDDNFDFVDNLSVVRGKHTMKIGADVRRDRYNTHGNYATRGQFNFQNQATGYSIGDFLTGYLNSTYHSVSEVSTQFRATSQAYFVSDNWKIAQNVTIDLGLRYEYTPPYSDKNSNYANVEIPYLAYTPQAAANEPQPTVCRVGSGDFYQGALWRFGPGIQTGTGCMGDRLVKADYKNFAPRVGVAWRPTPKTTVRTGAGFFYVQDIGNAFFDVSRNMAGRLNSVTNTTTNSLTFADPFNLLSSNTCGTTAPIVCITTPSPLAMNYDRRTPYVIQYEFNVQRELDKSTVAEIGYFGSESHFLPTSRQVNEPIPGSGAVAPRTPWPLLGPIAFIDTSANGNYQSLTAKLTRRLSSGLSFLAGYTFSKSIDEGSAYRLNPQDAGIQNSACLICERGLSAFDQRHRFVASILYELPVGKGHRLLTSGIGNQVFGGWQLSTIISASSGDPEGVATGTNRSGQGLADRPNSTGQNPALPSNQRNANEWFNIDAFTENAIGTYGNLGRNVVIGPGIFDVDFSAMKRFHFTERTYLEFRAEAFNSTNHPNLGDPGLNLAGNQLTATGAPIPGTGTFGVISSTRTDMRELQFALKLAF